DEILALPRIDPGLAADRGVDLRKQRGWDLHEIEAAAHAGRRKPREVTHHPAAKREHEIAALDARGDDRLAYGLEGGRAFGALTLGHHDARRVDAGRSERRLDRGEMMPRYRLVGDDRGAGARPQGSDALVELADQAAADEDVVGALAERDGHGDRLGATQRRGHGAPPVRASRPRWSATAAMISLTTVSCGSSRDCTTMSDCA